MTATPDLHHTILQLLRRFVSGHTGEISPGLALGADGLGMDSIAIVEFLLEVEAQTGRETASLLERQTLTLDDILQHVGASPRG